MKEAFFGVLLAGCLWVALHPTDFAVWRAKAFSTVSCPGEVPPRPSTAPDGTK